MQRTDKKKLEVPIRPRKSSGLDQKLDAKSMNSQEG